MVAVRYAGYQYKSEPSISAAIRRTNILEIIEITIITPNRRMEVKSDICRQGVLFIKT